METMAENQSSRWLDESIIEYEIQFYLKYPELQAEIRDRITENELDIQMPVTRYDEMGIYLYCPSTESQAIKRIEVREGLETALERMKKRIDRFNNAFNQLDKLHQEVIRMFYFEMIHDSRIVGLMGFESVRQMHQARRDALLDILYVYKEERKQRGIEEKLKREELKKYKAEALKEEMKRHEKAMERHRKALTRRFGGTFQ